MKGETRIFSFEVETRNYAQGVGHNVKNINFWSAGVNNDINFQGPAASMVQLCNVKVYKIFSINKGFSKILGGARFRKII